MSPQRKKAMGYSVNILHIDLKNDLFVCLFPFLSKKDWSLLVMTVRVIDWFSFVFLRFFVFCSTETLYFSVFQAHSKFLC